MHTDIRAAPGSPGGGALFVRNPKFARARSGYPIFMTDDRTGHRAADLLPEERVVGSADPEAQAEAILTESDEREADLEAAPDSFLEHRQSGQTPTPGEGTR
jgi:hypothetical protein